MAYNGKLPGKDEVANLIIGALRKDKEDVVINAEIQAEIDQPSFKDAEQQIKKLTKTRKVDVDTSKAEQKIKNLMEPLREVEKEIKALGTSGVDFNIAHNTIKRYEQLKNAVSEATKSISKNNQELREAQQIIRTTDGVISGLSMTVEKATKKRKSKQVKKTSEDIKTQTDAVKEQTDAMNVQEKVIDKTISSMKEQISVQEQQTKTIEAAARAQEKLNKAVEKQLKLTKKKAEDGHAIPQTYTAVDGKYEIEKGTVGWNLYEIDERGFYEFITAYETLNDLRKDSTLIAAQEAAAQGKSSTKITESQEKIVQELTILSDAYEEMSNRAGRTAKFAEQYGAMFKAVQGGALSAAEAIAQLNVEIDRINDVKTPNIVVTKSKYYEIDEEAARRAKENRSFDDYVRGSATASYRAAVDALEKVVNEKKEKFPDKAEQLDELLDKYAKNLAAFINRDNQIGAQYPSVMISGAGNYNIKKHDRQMASWGKNYQYYDDHVLAIENKIKNMGSFGEVAIRGDEEEALEKLEARLEYMKYWHQVMVEVNKYYRKNKTIEGFVGVEPDELERIKKDLATMQQLGMHDVPYPQYKLTNDNQNIKRIEGRIAELKRLKAEGGKSDSLQEENEFYKMWTDKKDMRIRISFEMGKPEQEIIDMLRGKAFKWFPKNGVWQRQLTDNAIYDAKKLQGFLREHYKINSQIEQQNASVPKLTSSYEGLADAVQKYTDSSKKLWEAYDAGKDFAKFADERNAAIEQIVNHFPKSATGVDPTLLKDGYAMYLQSQEWSRTFANDGAEHTLNVVEAALKNVKAQIDRSKNALEEANRQMTKTATLIGDLHSKYGNKFGEIFDGVINPFGGLNTTNAEDMYDALIVKEQMYVSEIKQRAAAVSELTKIANKSFQEFESVDEFQKKIADLSQQIIDGKININSAKQSLTEFAETLIKTTESNNQNNGLISSYKDLYRELEKLVNLSKQLKPGHTDEYEEMLRLTDNIGYVNNKEEAIAEIKAWYTNVQRIKSSLKNGLSIYKNIDRDGYEYESDATEYTLEKADKTLRGYIISAVENFGYTLTEAMNDFPKKRMRYFVEDQINKYYDIDARNSEYSAGIETFNMPIKEQIDSITTGISNMATSIDNMDQVSNTLFELTTRAKDVSRYTLSTESNKIGSLIGVQTPYEEIRMNAKRIKSYEELCKVVTRYNELQGDAVIYGGKEYPGFDENVEMEYRELVQRLKLTAGEDVFRKFRFDTPKDIEKLANASGIKLSQSYETENGQFAFIEGAKESIALENSLQEEIKETNELLEGQISIEEHLTSAAEQARKQLEQQQDISNIVSRDIIDKLLKGINPEAFLGSYGLKGDDLITAVDLFKDLASAEYLGADSPKNINDILSELYEFVVKNAQDTKDVVKVMGEFREYMNLRQVKIAENMEETFAAEFTDEWKDLKKLYAIGGNSDNKKKLLTKSRYATSPEKIIEELIENNLGHTLNSEMMRDYNGAPQNALRILLDAIRRAKAEVNMPSKQTIVGLDESHADDFMVRLSSVMGIVNQNIAAMRPAMDDASISGDKLADSAERAADATERQASAAESAANAINDRKTQINKLLKQDVESALTKLRTALNNKTDLIDLSGVFSNKDLEKELGSTARKILGDDSVLKFESVRIIQNDKGSNAAIHLVNEELGITADQLWQIKSNSDEAQESMEELGEKSVSQLEHVADQVKYSSKSAQKYAQAQEDALSKSEKSLLGYQKRLDNLTRSYQHGSKTLKGNSVLLLPDATTIKDDADKTLDGLAVHIKDRIDTIRKRLVDGNNMTKDEQNLFIQDLNALENEIKTMQADTYKAGNMSATEVNELRKSLTAMLDTLASKARKNNVFDTISESYQKLHDDLNKPELPGYLSDQNISDAVQRIRTLSKETTKAIQISGETKKAQQDLQQLLNLQERLYESKKKQIILEISSDSESSDLQIARRKTEELQAQYDTSVNLLRSEEDYYAVQQRELKLEQELKNVVDEKLTAKAKQTKAYEDAENAKVEKQTILETEAYDKEQTDIVKNQYKQILDLVNQINTANERMIKFQSMDGGSGLLNNKIEEEIQKKLEAVAKLEAVMSELNIGELLGGDRYNLPQDVESIGVDYSKIADFINDAGVQASLTTTEIEKLVNALVKAGDIDLSMLDTVLNSGSIKERAKQAAKEIQYFSDKTLYTDELDISQITQVGSAAQTTQEKLEGMAQSIATNSNSAVAMIKKFSQSADGISRLDFSVFDKESNSMKDFSIVLGEATGKVAVFETTATKMATATKTALNQLRSTGDLLARLGASGVNVGEGTAPAQVQKLLTLHQQLSSEINKGDNADQGIIADLTKRSKIAASEVEKLYKQMLQMDSAIENGLAKPIGIGDPTQNVYGQLADEAQKFAETQGSATLQIGRFDQATNTLYGSVIHTSGAVEELKFQMNGLNGQMTAQQSGVSKLTTSWDKFKISILSAGKHLMTALVGYNVFFKAISEVRKGIGYVKEIDLALTELKKVTVETEESYKNFLKTAAGTASEIGSTVSDFTEATANFARLGYTMTESADMAKTAIVYKNVADGLDTVEDATDSIISTMKAFGIESNNTIGIVDRFNEVGNNFAITSAGIGDALQRSASALFAAGNTIDESIALVTAANSVIQNPEQVGTALKTLSLRIRGVKTELEEAGLETEGMAKTTAQLQAKLKALTHGKVDIMLDADTFKNTTQILREMSAAWEDMTDMERAAALELIGGKRQANILSSVITNFETVEEVIETSMNSSGSAMEENAKWLDSIEGKTTQLTNAMQALWNKTINPDIIKSFLDFELVVIKLVDSIGLLPTVLAGVVGYFAIFKKITPVSLFNDLATNVRNYYAAMRQVSDIKSLNLGVENNGMLGIESVKAYTQALAGMSAKQQTAILTSAGLEKAHIAQILSQQGVEDATIRQLVGLEALNTAKQTTVAMTGAEIQATLAKQGATLSDATATWLADNATKELTKDEVLKAAAMLKSKGATDQEIIALLGLAGASNTASIGIKGVGKALWTMMSSNPIGWIMMLVSGFTMLISKIKQAEEEIVKSAKESVDAYKEVQKTLKDSKTTISEISGDYKKLAKGVDELGNNISLSTSEYERYNEIVNKIADMFPTMVKGYTEEGNAIIKNKGDVEALTKAYVKLKEQANSELLLSGEDIMQNYNNNFENKWYQNYSDSNDAKIKASNLLKEMLNSGDDYDFSWINDPNSSNSTFASVITDLLRDAGIDQPFFESGRDYIKRAISEFPSIVRGIVNSWDATVNAAVSQVKPLVRAYLDTSISYAGLTSEQKSMIDAIASDFGTEFFNQFNGDASAMYITIEEIIASIKQANIDDVFNATLDIQTRFNNGELTYDEYIAQINAFIAILDKLQADGILDAETVASLKVLFDFQPATAGNINDPLIESVKGLLDDEGDLNVGSVLTKTDLEIVDRYKEEWEELEGTEITLERLLELIKEIKEVTEDYDISDAIGDLDVIQESFSKLGDAFDEFRDGGIVTAETLAEIQEVFGNFEGFDKYAAVLGDSSSSMDDVKTALSGLATAYLENHDILSNLTEENEAFITSQLKAFGVINAEEYVAGMKAIHDAIDAKAEAYNIDLSNYATVEAMKTAIAEKFGVDVSNIEGDTVNELATRYGVDLSNYTNVELAKTRVAIEQAKIRALADKQKAISNAHQSANNKRDAQTFDGTSITNTEMSTALSGKTFEDIRDEYFAGKYDNQLWVGDVKNWLNTSSLSSVHEKTKATIDATNEYNKRIAELNTAADMIDSLNRAAVDYYQPLSVDASKLSGPDDKSKSGSDSANEFKETLDWVEIRLEEINEQIDLMNAKLENAGSHYAKNNIIDDIIGYDKTKMANLLAGIQKYSEYAAKLLAKVPAQYRDAAENGAIAISEFAGEADEKTVEAIENYREWAQKVADLRQQLEEVNAEIRELAIQKIDNIKSEVDARNGREDLQTEKLQSMVDLDEAKGLITSDAYYKAMMENSNKKIEYWTKKDSYGYSPFERMQKELNEAVKNGTIEVESVEWYEQIAKLYEVQAEINAATIELEEFQNAINQIKWDNFDQLINRLDYLRDETQSLIDLMDSDDMVITPETEDGWNADQVEWTEEGLASLGLYAQQMEIAEYQSKQYAEAIDDLTKDYKKGLYSENEYIEKLNELKSAQYDSIEAYYDAQDAIKDLQKARVDEIKNGIEKQVDAYEKLINKKKEALSAEKDLHDFQKQSAEQSKNIAQIERQLAALANDHSMAAMAKKRQLEAELAEAKAEQEELYYDRSIENQQTALDKELDSFKEQKDAEIQKWDEYLENVENLVAESLGIVQENAAGIGQTLTDKANEYNLTVSDAITTPWKDGSLAVSDYQTTFDTAMSSTMDQLEALKVSWQSVIDKMIEAGNTSVNLANKQNAEYAVAKKQEVTSEPVQDPPKQDQQKDPDPEPTNARSEKDYYGVALAIWQDSAYYGWGRGKTGDNNLKSKGFDPYKVQEIINKIGEDGYIKNGTWRGKYHGISDLSPYHINKFAKGTNSASKNQLAIIDELGEELQLVPGQNGRLEYIKKGTGIVPADLTKRLVDMAMDPQSMLDRNRPVIGAPHIINNEINIDCSVGEMVHIEHCDQNTLPDVEKLVNKAFDKHMQTLNNSIRRFTR